MVEVGDVTDLDLFSEGADLGLVDIKGAVAEEQSLILKKDIREQLVHLSIGMSDLKQNGT